jgi:hypothetical protein
VVVFTRVFVTLVGRSCEKKVGLMVVFTRVLVLGSRLVIVGLEALMSFVGFFRAGGGVHLKPLLHAYARF